MLTKYTWVAMAVSAVILAACGSETSPPDMDGPGSGDITRRLKTLDSSDNFYTALREGLLAQGGQYGGGVDFATDDLVVPATADTNDGGDAALSSTSGGEGSTEGNNEVTSTNVQEQGVDEQDWVKVSADGELLYVLNSTYPNVYPAVGPGIVDEGDANVPDQVGVVEPGEVDAGGTDEADVGGADEDIATTSVFAPQSVETTLRILQLDADSPDATPLNDLDIPLQGRSADGFYLYENGGARTAIVTSTGGGYWSYWGEPTAFAGLDSVIAKVDISDPDNASVSGSFKLDGQIISSRRIGKHLFFASRYYPALPGEQPWTQSEEDWQQLVDNTDLTTLLPQYSNDDSGETNSLIDPASCFVTDANNDYVYSPDVITLGVIDLDTLQLTDSECYLGGSETLYASPNAVFLATTQYDYSAGPVLDTGELVDIDNDFPVDDLWYDPRVDTDIHQFDIDNGQLVYAGTGTVEGHLGWNLLRKPFRMSEKDGYLRVATFNDRQGSDQSPILLTVLRADGQGNLAQVSRLPNEQEPGFIGKPGEQLYASRFLGDRAYLVTFRQTDPLYIVDLSNPAAPRVEGELEIRGYSDYLHPVSENYLLGIGKDAVAVDGRGDGRGALVQGVKLSLFDVSNPAAPSEVQSVLLGERGTDSQALSDHRAITVQAATEEHPMRVSFGVNVAGTAFPETVNSGGDANSYRSWTYTGLHGFDIKVGDDAGIIPRGSIVVETAGQGGYPSYNQDRSVMVNDSIFYVHGNLVYAAPWADLATPTPAR